MTEKRISGDNAIFQYLLWKLVQIRNRLYKHLFPYALAIDRMQKLHRPFRPACWVVLGVECLLCTLQLEKLSIDSDSDVSNTRKRSRSCPTDVAADVVIHLRGAFSF
jgi:hypothetical protein